MMQCNLLEIRTKKGLSRREICDKAGIKSENEYRAFEDYGRVPKILKAIALADALDVKDLRKIWS
jgi:transcriptional regulator with XRE-family HTH domain